MKANNNKNCTIQKYLVTGTGKYGHQMILCLKNTNSYTLWNDCINIILQ